MKITQKSMKYVFQFLFQVRNSTKYDQLFFLIFQYLKQNEFLQILYNKFKTKNCRPFLMHLNY